MPCRCDYMEPDKRDKESKKVAMFLVWVYKQLDKNLPEWIYEAAQHTYGNRRRADDLTKLLCAACRELPEEILYNGKDRIARELANWWEDHQEKDRIREEREKRKLEEKVKNVEKGILRQKALRKLSKEEREALGL